LAFLSRAYSKEKVIIAVAVEAYNFFVCYLIVIVVKEKLREMNFTSVVFGSSIHFSFHWNSKLHRTIIERHGTIPGNKETATYSHSQYKTAITADAHAIHRLLVTVLSLPQIRHTHAVT
jgi:menaquinone-dependent protoporphyrinogen IX oxidase